jgi:hypothetical protein
MKRIVAVAIFVLALSVGAFADEVTFSGTTTGIFSGSGTSTLGGLSFGNGSFSGTTSGGFLAIGGVSSNFGTFSLTTAPQSYGGTFTVTLTFAAPGGNSGPGSVTGSVIGVVTPGPAGGAGVLFSFAPTTFTFNNGGQSGSFEVFLNSIGVNAGQTNQALSGFILAEARNKPVPEPASLFLLGSGLIGGATTLRRKLAK